MRICQKFPGFFSNSLTPFYKRCSLCAPFAAGKEDTNSGTSGLKLETGNRKEKITRDRPQYKLEEGLYFVLWQALRLQYPSQCCVFLIVYVGV